MPRPAKGARLYYSRKDDRWLIRDSGQPDVGTGCAYGEHAQAEQKLQEHLARKYRPDFGKGDPARVSVLDVLKVYTDEHAPHTARPDVVKSANPNLGQFFAGKMVADLTPNVCRAYATWRTAQPQARYKVGPGYRFETVDQVPRVGSQTALRELGVLSAAIGYAHAEHRLLYPVVIAMPDKKPSRERWLSRSEAARLILAALGFRNVANDPSGTPVWRRPRVIGPDGKLRAEFDKSRHVARFILTGLYTGTRHEAILRLKWLPTTAGGYVDLRGGILYRRGQGEGESSKRRTPVPLSNRLQAHMRRWKGQSVSHVIEFEGMPLERLRRAWNTARLAAGLGEEVTPHILRHSFATWAVREGVSFGMVALALGTTERIVRDVYGHHAPEHMRGVVEAVSAGRR
ncbi:site-specific integrase [Methylobacterium sp. WL120]|uniref:tyrosine-type recombinase/integrase n=1 Tax=Methylobacterium sp. WL120 TaxID=2603887 RepID=UPI0011C90379|nr:site-specific integrase [Methylobacterium sp. WL120]TXM65856.1 site-specific integrase [Methylobacterium sp. WL120]